MELTIFEPETVDDILEPLKAVNAGAKDGFTAEVAGVFYEDVATLRVYRGDNWNDRLDQTKVVLRDESGDLMNERRPNRSLLLSGNALKKVSNAMTEINPEADDSEEQLEEFLKQQRRKETKYGEQING